MKNSGQKKTRKGRGAARIVTPDGETWFRPSIFISSLSQVLQPGIVEKTRKDIDAANSGSEIGTQKSLSQIGFGYRVDKRKTSPTRVESSVKDLVVQLAAHMPKGFKEVNLVTKFAYYGIFNEVIEWLKSNGKIYFYVKQHFRATEGSENADNYFGYHKQTVIHDCRPLVKGKYEKPKILEFHCRQENEEFVVSEAERLILKRYFQHGKLSHIAFEMPTTNEVVKPFLTFDRAFAIAAWQPIGATKGQNKKTNALTRGAR